MSTSPIYRYRVAYAQTAPREPLADPALLEHLFVQAADATHARRAVAAVTGAAVVCEPERLAEVLPAEPQMSMGENGGLVVWA